MSTPWPLAAKFWQPTLAALQAQLGVSSDGLSEAEAELGLVVACLADMLWAKQLFYRHSARAHPQ